MKKKLFIALCFVIGTIRTAINAALTAVVVSAIFTALKYICSLISICDKPTWHTILWGTISVFIVLFAIMMYFYIKDSYHMLTDERFRQANERTGISYEEYRKYFK